MLKVLHATNAYRRMNGITNRFVPVLLKKILQEKKNAHNTCALNVIIIICLTESTQ